MKRIVIALAMVWGLGVTAPAQNADSNDVNRAVLQELRQMRAALERITDEVTQLRKHEAETAARADEMAGSNTFQARRADIRQLAQITLPEHASKDQIKKYILDILAASRGQNSFSDRDPQVAMLAKVGADNIQLLLDALSYGGDMNNYHVEHAIQVLADEQSKPLILGALPVCRDLVTVIVQRGWEKDAREILLTELRDSPRYLPTEWITAVVSLNDTNSYPLLRNYFIKGENKYWTYKAIKNLPIEHMAEAVDGAWQRSKFGDECNRMYMALAALEYGHVDALAALIDSLASGEADHYSSPYEVRAAVLRAVDFRGSNEDLARWFKANRSALRFDPQTRKYVADKPGDPSVPTNAAKGAAAGG